MDELKGEAKKMRQQLEKEMNIKTRINHKNVETILSMRALAGKEDKRDILCNQHKLMNVMYGQINNLSVTLKECIVCGYIQWVDK